MSESAPIDRAVFDDLLDRVGGDTEFLAELLQAYFDDSPKLLEAMRMALVGGNAEEFRRAAHSLKSSSANFGAMKLSRMCKELEDMGKAGILDNAGEGMAHAEMEYGRVRAMLQTLSA